MELEKSFDPHTIEKRWYPEWENQGYFKHSPSKDGPAYCIQLPPPNVTGTLHMGHAFQQTLMDILIRYHRMKGNNTNWVIGTDHAGIATQIVVERQLEAKGKTRHELGREEFLRQVWAWKQESGSTITRQMRRLGVSGNWSFADSEGQNAGYFTMDSRMSAAVSEVFVRLNEAGLIYRGKRLVNWDPVLGTAVSDLEVEAQEEDGRIWEIRYPFEDGSGFLTVATTRPETMLGDVAVAVNPNDERYAAQVGKTIVLPLVGRRIPLIADEYVDREFGTGCVKITPAHDFNDYQLGQRHGFEPISILTLKATISDDCPAPYRGLDRFEARKRILQDLQANGLLQSEKPHKLRVPRSGRTGVIVEPMLTDQWFVKMEGLAARGLAAVEDGRVRFHPEHWATTYNHWLENIQDWCISRQLWWGHQIPAWYDESGNVYVARSEADARAMARSAGYAGSLRRDEDVLDTWFSSALVPFTTLGWPDNTSELKAFLPSSVLVTGFDIIFFWVARMIMMTLHFTDKVPFRDVYINALVRDADGQKMSKSKGNTLDPLDLIDGISLDDLLKKSTIGLMKADHKEKIEKYITKNYPQGIPSFGVDALRFTFASQATFARTLNFDLSRCEGYRNFCNKLWNATRFVLMNTEGKDCGQDDSLPAIQSPPDRWIVSLLQKTEAEVERSLAAYRFDNAAGAIYKFVWDEYCDWYLEFAKVQLADNSGDHTDASHRGTRRTLVRVLEAVLRLAHPFIPFISEELWQKVSPLACKSGPSVMTSPFPTAQAEKIDENSEILIGKIKEVILACRNLRGEMRVSPADRVPLIAVGEQQFLRAAFPYLRSLARLSETTIADALPDLDAPVALAAECRLMLKIEVDSVAERERIQKEVSRLENEVQKAKGKLAKDSFISRAPADVVNQERERLASFAEKLERFRAQLQKLSN